MLLSISIANEIIIFILELEKIYSIFSTVGQTYFYEKKMSKLRKASHAGSWYSDDGNKWELQVAIRNFKYLVLFLSKWIEWTTRKLAK